MKRFLRLPRQFLLWLLRPLVVELIKLDVDRIVDEMQELEDDVSCHEHSDLADACDVDQIKADNKDLEVRIDNLESEVADLG